MQSRRAKVAAAWLAFLAVSFLLFGLLVHDQATNTLQVDYLDVGQAD